MRRHHPYAILILLFTAAFVLLAGGIRFAKREQHIRETPGREQFTSLAGSMVTELGRLDALYESHLRRVAEGVSLTSEFEIRDECESVLGIVQFALLHSGQSSRNDFHVDFSTGEALLPVPTFDPKADALAGREHLLLEMSAVTEPFGPDSGWIDHSSGALFFWARRIEEKTVLLRVDRQMVMDAVNGSLSTWLKNPLIAPAVATDRIRIMDPSGNSILAAGRDAATHEGEPDLVLPLRTRYGTWGLARWDEFQVLTTYHAPTLTVAAVLAFFLASSGILAFRHQREALRLAEKRVSFVNRVSHELRTPLTNILLNSDLALDAAQGDVRVRRRLDLIRQEAGRLGRMIENVLTFSGSERGEIGVAESACSPDEIVRGVLDQFEPALRQKSIEVHRVCGAPETVRTDPDGLALILSNLVSNVEKYAAGGGFLSIVSELNKDTLDVTVADRGPGIPPRESQRVFRPFERLRPDVREGATGTGLGLSIARDYAERLGGSLELLASEQGAVFRLRLPVRPGNVVQIEGNRAS